MRARPNRLHSVLLLFAVAFTATPSFATSVGKSIASKASVCAVSARFTGTKFYHGKLLWLFDRIGNDPTKNCDSISRSFEVLIPSGSFSAISNSNVYPLSIVEPPLGAEIDLQLESVKFKSGGLHWLIADDAAAFRVRR